MGGMGLAIVGCGILALILGAGLGYALAAGRYALSLESLTHAQQDLQRQLTAAQSGAAENTGGTSQASKPQLAATNAPPLVAPPPRPSTETQTSILAQSANATDASAPTASADEFAALSSFVAAAHHAGALLIVDVDYLGKFREMYGPQLSEYISNHVERVIRDALENTPAVISRYEDQEFLVALPETPGSPAERLHGARRYASQLRSEIERSYLQVGSERLTVTASLGLAMVEAGVLGEVIIARADEALHAAKRAGRNRAYFLSPSGECLPVDPLPGAAVDIKSLESSRETTQTNESERRSLRGKAGCRDRRRHERKPCPSVNLIAPCSDNVLPAVDKFERVQFLDLSVSGFSMILPAVPTTGRFAVALFNTRGMIFMSAEVANVRQAPRVGHGKPLVIVGCKFRQRLYPTQPMPSFSPPPAKMDDPALTAILQSL
jgi:diguanylate cyclase (GGDEF)-like protein